MPSVGHTWPLALKSVSYLTKPTESDYKCCCLMFAIQQRDDSDV